MAQSANYALIRTAIIAQLVTDAVLTDPTTGLLANVALDGGAPSRQNSIFYSGPPTDQQAFPCVTLLDLTTGPGVPDQHSYPMGSVKVMLELGVWGRSQDVGAIKGELDLFLENIVDTGIGALDTAFWKFLELDTSDAWHGVQVPSVYLVGNVPIEQHVKTFTVDAANKTIGS